MFETGKQQNVHRTLGGYALRGSQSVQYLKVGLKARGATPGPVLREMNGVFAKFTTLKPTKALVREMNMTTKTEMHAVFFEST